MEDTHTHYELNTAFLDIWDGHNGKEYWKGVREGSPTGRVIMGFHCGFCLMFYSILVWIFNWAEIEEVFGDRKEGEGKEVR